MSVNVADTASKPPLDPQISRIINSVLKVTTPEQPNGYEKLLEVAIAALKFFPPFYIQSILGPMNSWIPPYRKESEFTILDLWHPIRSLDYLIDVTVPAHSHAPNRWARTLLPPPIQHLFWRPSNYFQQPDPFDNVTSFNKEHWFFINGVATNEAVAKINSNLISQLFQRPVSVIHNATDSIALDLVQCAIGKEFETNPDLDERQSMTEPAIKAAIAILEAIKDPERDKVVVLCHSQGTIITANVLRALQRCLCHIQVLRDSPDTQLDLNLIDEITLKILCIDDMLAMADNELESYLVETIRKLEVYTFANCADKMTYITHTTNSEGEKIGLPYIENFANQFDLVARLGVLSPLRKTDPSVIRIDGDVYEKQGSNAWGHLLNQHYLFGIEAFLKGKTDNPYLLMQEQEMPVSENPRLYDYHEGGRPTPYYQ